MQLFLKTTQIKKGEWDISYNRILQIVNQFPLQLERIESYNGFSQNLDKIHYDLVVNRGEEDEHISFWSDKMSYSGGYSIKFYKNWEVQKKNMIGSEIDSTKPIAWYPSKIYNFSGEAPEANSAKLNPDYLSTNAPYRYAFLAIGIMLENTLLGRALFIDLETNIDQLDYTKDWLQYIFKEEFDVPLIFDKVRLLDSIEDHYENKVDLVGRLDTLYKDQFENNMEFALQHIAYTPTFEYYAHVLSHAYWGTFSFSDVLQPWMTVTNDIEKTLELIASSKQILLSDKANEKNIAKANKYNYADFLKTLLNQYILWTPSQRELLDEYEINDIIKEAQSNDALKSLMRLVLIEICPIYTNPNYLFESFMYHDPKNGKKYKIIIDNWIKTNKNSFEKYIKNFEKGTQSQLHTIEEEDQKQMELEAEMQEVFEKILEFSQNYAPDERFFVTIALLDNPSYINQENEVEQLQTIMFNFYEQDSDILYYQYNKNKEEKLELIYRSIKSKPLSIVPEFLVWLEEENDHYVLTSIILLVSLRLYEKRLSYARQLILFDKKYWKVWEKGQKFSVSKTFDKYDQ